MSMGLFLCFMALKDLLSPVCVCVCVCVHNAVSVCVCVHLHTLV